MKIVGILSLRPYSLYGRGKNPFFVKFNDKEQEMF